MASLFLIRHGEPAVTGVMLGQMDPPLSRAGRIEASAALRNIHVEVVWTSPLRRARDTAALMHATRIVEIPELKEIDQGKWTGKTWSEIESEWGETAARKSSNWFGIPAPGGETWADFLERVRKAWQVIRAGPAPSAVIAHQGVNAALMHLIAGRNPLEFTQQYGEVIPIEFE